MHRPEDIGVIMDGAVTIAVTVVACWFVEWLRNGFESQQSKIRHDEQLEILRTLESKMSKPSRISDEPAVPYTTSEDPGNIDKYSRVRLALDDLNESCKKLEDKYSILQAEKQKEVGDLNEMNTKLQHDLNNTQEKLKLSIEAHKEAEKVENVNRRLERDLKELQSEHVLSEMELAAARAQIDKVEKEATVPLEALQSKYDDALDEVQKTKSELEHTQAEYFEMKTDLAKLQSLRKSQDKAFNDANQEKLELQEGKKRLERQCQELRVKVAEMKNIAGNDTKKGTDDNLKTVTAQLQLQIQDVQDEKTKLAKEVSALKERCAMLAAQRETLQTTRRGSHATRIASPLSAESQRNQQEFEKKLSQNEQKIRDLQNSSPPSSPTNKPLSQRLSSTPSGAASPTTLPSRASSPSSLPVDNPELENMDLYESPTSPTAHRRPVIKPIPSIRRINDRARQPPFIDTGSISGSELEFTIPLSSAGVFTGAVATKFEAVWPISSSRGSPAASPGQSPRSQQSRSQSSPSLPPNQTKKVPPPSQSPSQASGGPPSRPESFLCDCGVTLPLAQREEHELGCMAECEKCNKKILKTKLDWHRRSQCLSVECDYCDEMITLEDREKQHPDCEVSGDDKWKMDAQAEEF